LVRLGDRGERRSASLLAAGDRESDAGLCRRGLAYRRWLVKLGLDRDPSRNNGM